MCVNLRWGEVTRPFLNKTKSLLKKKILKHHYLHLCKFYKTFFRRKKSILKTKSWNTILCICVKFKKQIWKSYKVSNFANIIICAKLYKPQLGLDLCKPQYLSVNNKKRDVWVRSRAAKRTGACKKSVTESQLYLFSYSKIAVDSWQLPFSHEFPIIDEQNSQTCPIFLPHQRFKASALSPVHTTTSRVI